MGLEVVSAAAEEGEERTGGGEGWQGARSSVRRTRIV